MRNLESRIEGLVEGVFSRAFSSEVQPVELARRLAKEMDSHKTAGVQRVYVPNEYTVFLSSRDRDRLEGYERSLEQELSGYLLEHARRRDYDLLTRPEVEFKTDERLRLGEFGIQTRLVKPPAREGAAPTPGRGGPHDGLLGGALGAASRSAERRRGRTVATARSSRSTTAATSSRARGRRSAAPRTPTASCATPTSRATTPSSAAPRPATGRSPTSARPTGSRSTAGASSSTRLGPGDEVTLGTTPSCSTWSSGPDRVDYDPISVALKFGFLAVLYLFLLWIARSALKDLRGTVAPAPDATGFHPAPASTPAPRAPMPG